MLRRALARKTTLKATQLSAMHRSSLTAGWPRLDTDKKKFKGPKTNLFCQIKFQSHIHVLTSEINVIIIYIKKCTIVFVIVHVHTVQYRDYKKNKKLLQNPEQLNTNCLHYWFYWMIYGSTWHFYDIMKRISYTLHVCTYKLCRRKLFSPSRTHVKLS